MQSDSTLQELAYNHLVRKYLATVARAEYASNPLRRRFFLEQATECLEELRLLSHSRRQRAARQQAELN